jgi:hypothetical protein
MTEWISKNLDAILVGFIGAVVSVSFLKVINLIWPTIYGKYIIHYILKSGNFIKFDGKLYAWGGPINKLKNEEYRVMPKGLSDALRAIDYSPSSCINENVKIEQLKVRGTFQIFEIENASKRDLRIYPDQVMLVTHKAQLPKLPENKRRRIISPGIRINDIGEIFGRRFF